MRVERRQESRRVSFSSPPRVRILAIDGTWFRDSLLIDASDSGARLEIDGSMTSAKEFFLMLSFNQQPAFRRCKMVWINGNQAGVAFDRRPLPGPETTRGARTHRLEAA